MIQLANILHSKGFSITIIHTTFNSPDPSKYRHLTFHCIQEELTETEASTTDIIDLVSFLNIKCVAPFRDCVSKLLSDAAEDPIACLISDAIFHFTNAVSKSLKLPRIVLRTGGASSFRVFTAFPLLKEKGYLPIQESRLEETVAELPPIKVKDLPVINSRDPESVYELVVSMVNETKASSGVIWNTYEELEQSPLAALRHEFSIPIFPIGPFHNRFQSSSRVPMICTPRFTDQLVNARYVSDVWRVGVQLGNGLDREKIERTVELLLANEEGEAIRKRILSLKEKAKLCLSKGGSSCQSLDSLVSHILSLEPIIFQTE
ncbi:unnamed protein product [Dovyalis caffra]|uniref:UDP-glycosyltransferase n=1 Tax=Dovyalis caffra TaxID=77055 RepID=A0AAV1R0A3_9ROSI|nr:unnamed protein product [Dovyalis caffra]